MIIYRPLRREEGKGAALGLISLLVSVAIILILVRGRRGRGEEGDVRGRRGRR